MCGPERIVLALAALGKTRKPAALPQGGHAAPPASKNFVGISLVANVPDQPIARGIEHVVHGGGQFNHTKARTKMPAGLADRVDHLSA